MYARCHQELAELATEQAAFDKTFTTWQQLKIRKALQNHSVGAKSAASTAATAEFETKAGVVALPEGKKYHALFL